MSTSSYKSLAIVFIASAFLAQGCASAVHSQNALRDPISANERIDRIRKGDFKIVTLDASGKPMEATVSARMISHKFLFGCNIFQLNPPDHSEAQKTYREKFKRVFNYATLPFYWGAFEPKKGVCGYDRLMAMAEWCRENGIETKGHPLVWFVGNPAWLQNDTGDIETLMEACIRDIVSRYKGLIGRWDVINESSNVTSGADGALNRMADTIRSRIIYKDVAGTDRVWNWIAEIGRVEAAAKAFAWVRGADPDATLLINDFSLTDRYYDQVKDMLAMGVRIDAVGLQSHMHTGEYSTERLWEICERFGSLGPPLHFTEMTILSGRHKAVYDLDWWGAKSGWETTADGEARQAAEVERVYRILFSHPKVEAITWWDFQDGPTWQGAPAGLLRKDGSEKPAYEVLDRLINREWSTNVSGRTNGGVFRFRGFNGTYVLTMTDASGAKTERTVLLDGDRMRIELRTTAEQP